MKKAICILLGALLALSVAGCAKSDLHDSSKGEIQMTDQEFTISQLAGTDALGRKITPATGRKEKKYVGIYYFLWHGYHTQKIYDTAKILEKFENGIVGNPENPLWEINPTSPNYNAAVSPNGAFHYWGEPLYGYYNSEDPWIARKHLELLSYADVDYLLLDYTNTYIYENSTKVLIEAILEMQKEGWNVPQIAFMLPIDAAASEQTFTHIYEEYLSVPQYANAFFIADQQTNPSGKPLVTGTLGEETENIKAVWYIPLQWPGRPYDDDALPWIDWAKNNVQYNHDGKMCVSIAQHTNGIWSSDPYLYPGKQFFRGRGWQSSDPLDNGADEENSMKGTNFQFQWDNVFKNKEEVDMVVVTGWNEWIAQKQSTLENTYHTSMRAVFVDSFNLPFSRDAEMMAGGYGDNYYLQLVQNIRKFKFDTVDTSAAENTKKTIDIKKGISEWSDISRIYLDAAGEVIERNFKSVDPSVIYTDKTNRNDVVSLKMANDTEYLYLRIETKKPVTAYEEGDTSWMNVYISTDEAGGRENYNYVVNRFPKGDGTTSVQKIGVDDLTERGSARYLRDENYIFLAIPFSSLNVSSGKEIQLKITDNLQGFLNSDDFYVSGECAPIGRLNYAVKLA